MLEAWILTIILLAILASMTVYRETSIVKKTWKYVLAVVPIIVIAIVKSINKRPEDIGTKPIQSEIAKPISEIKSDLIEAQSKSSVDDAVVREDNKNKIDQLKQAAAIADSDERRQKLSELMG